MDWLSWSHSAESVGTPTRVWGFFGIPGLSEYRPLVGARSETILTNVRTPTTCVLYVIRYVVVHRTMVRVIDT